MCKILECATCKTLEQRVEDIEKVIAEKCRWCEKSLPIGIRKTTLERFCSPPCKSAKYWFSRASEIFELLETDYAFYCCYKDEKMCKKCKDNLIEKLKTKYEQKPLPRKWSLL